MLSVASLISPLRGFAGLLVGIRLCLVHALVGFGSIASLLVGIRLRLVHAFARRRGLT
jgi:hypothetical protein